MKFWLALLLALQFALPAHANEAPPLAQDPVVMAGAFADAVQAGRSAYLSGAMQAQDAAQPSTPVLGTPFWHHAQNQ